MNINKLDKTIKNFLLEMVGEIWNAPDEGSTRSGNFAENDPEIGSSDAAQYLKIIQSTPEKFFGCTEELAKLLHARTPGTASSGVLGIMRIVQKQNDEEQEEEMDSQFTIDNEELSDVLDVIELDDTIL